MASKQDAIFYEMSELDNFWPRRKSNNVENTNNLSSIITFLIVVSYFSIFVILLPEVNYGDMLSRKQNMQ